MTVLFMYNLRSLFNKFPTIFESLIFRISLTKLIYFSKKREADIFGFENVMECDGMWWRGIRKIPTFVQL